jgi:CheY-like chemotaxis protein
MSAADRVLIVDDDEATRDLVDLVLSDEGYDVLAAPDGATALAVAKSEHPDVILVDQRMPVMDGAEFIRSYHQLPGEQAAIIALTAGPLDEGVEVDATLTKPFDVEDLIEVVSRQVH